MLQRLLSWTTILLFFQWAPLCFAQYPPPLSNDRNITTIRSPANGNITISYKTPLPGTCTTVFPNQEQYSGYVTLPPFSLTPIQQNYTINTFFWFIEARTNPSTAPLTIYINGGPGSSSMVGLFQETGPCQVVEVSETELGTEARDWGWDRSSNVLYIDQPNQVGFSYDILTNGSLNLLSADLAFPPTDVPPNQPADTYINGTFPSNNYVNTANTTQIAGYAIWHMLQAFLTTFPEYNPGSRPNSTITGPVGVNLFAESYGGKYGPAFATLWEGQNELRRNGSIPSNTTLEIQLSTLGIMQGCVDDLVQGRYYPIFANNNTYGIQALSLTEELTVADAFLNAGGCQQKIQACRTAAASLDPSDYGNVSSVNELCQQAQENCNDNVIAPYTSSGRDVYDISQMVPDSFPPSTYLEYLNSAAVQASIGAGVNYTETSATVATAFLTTGDYDRGTQIAEMASLLALGVRVALIYGDRDYICNWLGGEAVSFAIAAQSPALAPFYSAGYAEIVTNSSYVGGVVRQYGNLSFSRIYDAGHLIPAYQPETAFTVFTRVIMGTDISTGEPVDLSSYVSTGDANATYLNTPLPEQNDAVCWIRNVLSTCTSEQQLKLAAGQGVIINGVLYDQESDWQEPASSVSLAAGRPGTFPMLAATSSGVTGSGGSMSATVSSTNGVPMIPTASSSWPTGVYVATATPTGGGKKSGAGGRVNEMDLGRRWWGFVWLVGMAAWWIF
ncbi:hypothetical protein MMC25_005871 [Agyrium rufum]|nr:hypothetical protein [Agyrium rufum]